MPRDPRPAGRPRGRGCQTIPGSGQVRTAASAGLCQTGGPYAIEHTASGSSRGHAARTAAATLGRPGYVPARRRGRAHGPARPARGRTASGCATARGRSRPTRHRRPARPVTRRRPGSVARSSACSRARALVTAVRSTMPGRPARCQVVNMPRRSHGGPGVRGRGSRYAATWWQAVRRASARSTRPASVELEEHDGGVVAVGGQGGRPVRDPVRRPEAERAVRPPARQRARPATAPAPPGPRAGARGRRAR